MKNKLIILLSISMIAVLLTACGNGDSKVNQVIQNQMMEEDNKANQSNANQSDSNREDSTSVVTAEPSDADDDGKTDDGSNAVAGDANNYLSGDADNPSDDGTAGVGEDTGASGENDGTVDVDLTLLSSTMVYSEVFDMMYSPEKYIGKVIRMRGMFVTYTNLEGTLFYPAVIIADATACCSQGLEFLLEGNPRYPEGYPEIGIDITVVGTFETYVEDGNLYCRLQNARIE